MSFIQKRFVPPLNSIPSPMMSYVLVVLCLLPSIVKFEIEIFSPPKIPMTAQLTRVEFVNLSVVTPTHSLKHGNYFLV